MSNATKFYREYANSIKQSVRTFLPAQVINYNEDDRTCDVQPLYLETTDYDDSFIKLPLLEDVPIIDFRLQEKGSSEEKIFQQVFKQDDVVFIAVCDRDIDNLQRKLFLPDSKNMFSLKDAVVIGGWQL